MLWALDPKFFAWHAARISAISANITLLAFPRDPCSNTLDIRCKRSECHLIRFLLPM